MVILTFVGCAVDLINIPRDIPEEESEYGAPVNNADENEIRTIVAEKNKKLFLTCKTKNTGKVIWKRNSKPIIIPPPYEKHWEYGSILIVWPLIQGRTDGLYECIVECKCNMKVMIKAVKVAVKEGNFLSQQFHF